VFTKVFQKKLSNRFGHDQGATDFGALAPHQSSGITPFARMLDARAVTTITKVGRMSPNNLSRRVIRATYILMTRSKNLLLITGLIIACSAANSLAQEKSEATTIRALELKWTESYKQRSIDILSSLLAEEFVITVEDGNVYSKAGYISHTADSKVRVDVAEMSDLKVRVHGDAAIVTGSYHEKGVSEGKTYEYRDRLTDVWVKTAGKWQVVASHYSVPVKQ